MGSNELIHSDVFTFSALNCSSKTPAHTHWTLIKQNIFIWGVWSDFGGGWGVDGWVGGGGWEGRTTLVALTLVQSSPFLFVLFRFGHSVIARAPPPPLSFPPPPPPPPHNHSFSSDGVYSLRHKWWNTGIKNLWASTELFLKFVAWICQWWIQLSVLFICV